MKITTSAVLACLTAAVSAQVQGTGATTRYWDCCKPSCGWPGKANLASGPLRTCDKADNPLNDGGNTSEFIRVGLWAWLILSGYVSDENTSNFVKSPDVTMAVELSCARRRSRSLSTTRWLMVSRKSAGRFPGIRVWERRPRAVKSE